jgi:hypothetical protein
MLRRRIGVEVVVDPVTLALVVSALASTGAVAATARAVAEWLKRDQPVHHLKLEVDGRRVEIDVKDAAQVEVIVEQLMRASAQDSADKPKSGQQ